MPKPAPVTTGRWRTWLDHALPALACVLVIGFYFGKTRGYVSELGHTTPRDAYYNQLVAGFAAGQLNLPVDVPPGLAALADPYDPPASDPFRKHLFAPGRLHDTSYYHGKIYLYFGVSPALLLFWPWHTLTGGYLDHADAVAMFCTVGFLAATGLLLAARRRYFPDAPLALVVGGILALGFANSVPVMLARPDVWEVPISCGHALVLLALAAVWCALHEPARAPRWLAAASLAYGLAIGARPSLLPGAIIVFLPLLPLARAGTARLGPALLAALLPLAIVGAGLARYNDLRFGSPFEFGQHYQLADDRQDVGRHFSPGYLFYNFRLYFFSFAPWRTYFPFFDDIVVPPLPAGHGAVDRPFGILVNTPITLLALAAPLAWRGRADGAPLRGFATALALLFASAALVLGFFYGTCTRYQVEFHPPLVFLACLGGFGLAHRAGRSAALRTACVVGGVGALLYSTAFGILKSNQGTIERLDARAVMLSLAGHHDEAIALFDEAVRLDPARPKTRHDAAIARRMAGRTAEAIAAYEAVLRVAPDHVDALGDLAHLLRETGRLAESAQHLAHAARVQPDSVPLVFGLGVTWLELQRPADAVPCFERAIRLQPAFAPAHFQLAVALAALGRTAEARAHADRAHQLDPSLPRLFN